MMNAVCCQYAGDMNSIHSIYVGKYNSIHAIKLLQDWWDQLWVTSSKEALLSTF